MDGGNARNTVASSSMFYPRPRRAHPRRPNERRLRFEQFEDRRLLSVAPPIVRPDAGSTTAGAVVVDVLANDSSPGGMIDPASLSITSGPSHGTVRVVESRTFSADVNLAPDFSYYDDEGSPLGDGHASALAAVVDRYGHLKLKVSQYFDYNFNGADYVIGVPRIGDYALFILRNKSDFSNFSPERFDFRFRDQLRPGKVDTYDIPGQTPGSSFIAWIDNTVGSGTPDTMLFIPGHQVVEYDPEDPDFLGDDSFRYTVRDTQGNRSAEATVRVSMLRPAADAADDFCRILENNAAVVAGYSDLDPLGRPDRHEIIVTSAPAHGTAAVLRSDDGPYLVYTPNPGFVGQDILRYVVDHEHSSRSREATVSIEVVTPNAPPNAPPIALDDVVAASRNTPASIDVLANDSDSDGALDATSLRIVAAPSHGTAVVRQTSLGPRIVYTPASGYLGPDAFRYTIGDGEGAVSNEAVVTVNPPPILQDDSASTTENMPVAIPAFANDEAQGPSAVLVPSSVAIVAAPARGRVVLRQAAGEPVLVYTPNQGSPSRLVVDEASDVDDGVYTAGRLSLREAIKLANNDRYADTFSYRLRDSHGIYSSATTVTVSVAAAPTTITFAAALTSGGSRAIRLSRVGDVSEGNSALAVTTPISIVAPAGQNRVSLTGPGPSGDLRLFLVGNGGQLTLRNIDLARGASDGNGGAIFTLPGSTLSMVGCQLSGHFAYDNGGAIFNQGTAELVNCTVLDNAARNGGGIANLGPLRIQGSTVARNRAEQGGGLDNRFDTATIASTTFSENTAQTNVTNCVRSMLEPAAGQRSTLACRRWR